MIIVLDIIIPVLDMIIPVLGMVLMTGYGCGKQGMLWGESPEVAGLQNIYMV
jgi:hypothetical protein